MMQSWRHQRAALLGRVISTSSYYVLAQGLKSILTVSTTTLPYLRSVDLYAEVWLLWGTG